MNDNALIQAVQDHGVWVAFAFLIGLFLGWAIWGAPWRDDLETEGSATGDAKRDLALDIENRSSLLGSLEDVPPHERIALIERDIAHLRQEVSAAEGDEELEAELTALDDAVKRANGRLKLVLAQIDRAADRASEQDGDR